MFICADSVVLVQLLLPIAAVVFSAAAWIGVRIGVLFYIKFRHNRTAWC